jgi:hypothetical protein
MQETDIIVTVNVPYRGTDFVEDVIDPMAKPLNNLLQRGVQNMQAIISSFEVKDWSLFGEA